MAVKLRGEYGKSVKIHGVYSFVVNVHYLLNVAFDGVFGGFLVRIWDICT